MRRKYKLRNERLQQIATILYSFEEQLNGNVGMIFTDNPLVRDTWLFQDESIDQVVADLALRLDIQYHDYIEVN